jgi:hypothetical protein
MGHLRPPQRANRCVPPLLLVWGFFCQGSRAGARVSLLHAPVSLFDLAARFLAPTHDQVRSRRAQKQSRMARSATRRSSSLDGFEHNGTLERVGG